MNKLTSYSLGFVLSIALTLAAPALLWLSLQNMFITPQMLRFSFVILAILQLLVQLFFFLHIGEERKPRWNLGALGLALIIVCIVVGGTLWIMHNLMHMQTSDQQIFSGENIFPDAHGN